MSTIVLLCFLVIFCFFFFEFFLVWYVYVSDSICVSFNNQVSCGFLCIECFEFIYLSEAFWFSARKSVRRRKKN